LVTSAAISADTPHSARCALSPGVDRTVEKQLQLRQAMPPLRVVLITLRNRTLSRTVELFLDCVRDVAKSIDR
jgi:hypothetical protein